MVEAYSLHSHWRVKSLNHLFPFQIEDFDFA